MPVADPIEASDLDRAIAELFTATPAERPAALRRVFVERLDFAPAAGEVPLHQPDLPPAAQRVAERDGVDVVLVQFPEIGRLTARPLAGALKRARQTLGDVLLVATNADGAEWQFVYPAYRAGREVLRRLAAQRDQPRRTVVEQLAGVYRDAERGDLRGALERAYDVEAVTKRFFTEYRRVFEAVMAMVTGLQDDEERKLFCQTLFNRLMFLYFLQRKGWLTFDGDPDYLNALWRSWKPAAAGPATAVACGPQRGPLRGTAVPGAPAAKAAWQGTDTEVSDEDATSTFYRMRLKLLFFTALNNPRSGDFSNARYVAEEMIGRVPFLNGGLFAEGELDGRAGVDVPDEAIRLILKDLFARFNFTITESTPYDVEVAVDPEMLGKVFEELVTGRHETGSYYTPRPVVAFMCREALKGYLAAQVAGLSADAAAAFVDEHEVGGLTLPQAGAVLDALERITVVDPACGSGAYLLGMLHELVDVQKLLYNSALIAGAKELYELKLRVIERNVYGVDVDPFAVNIAMLRLWLSLVVDYEGPGDPPPLPNLDYKIARGDTLTAPDPKSYQQLALAHELIVAYRTAKGQFLHAHGEEKRLLRAEIESLRHDIGAMPRAGSTVISGFDWAVEFAEVFERGGFDAVLANPPYVRQELIKDQKPALKAVYGDLYSGTADLYVYFYYRALQLLKSGGMLVFISSNKWFRTNYGAKLRQHIAETCHVVSITDFGDLPVFESATAYPMIFVAQKGAAADGPTHFTEVASLEPPYPDVLALVQERGQRLPSGAMNGEHWVLADADSAALIRMARGAGIPLGQYVQRRIYYGIKTGFNVAFVLDGQERADLITQDPGSAEIIKPLAAGKNIRRWCIDTKDYWLIVTPIGVDMERYPAIFAHLKQWQMQLSKRYDQGNHWWELRACDYYDAFEQPKIVFPDIAKAARFAFDNTGTYVDTTAFIMPFDDLYLLGVLNSRSVEQFYIELSAQVRGG